MKGECVERGESGPPAPGGTVRSPRPTGSNRFSLFRPCFPFRKRRAGSTYRVKAGGGGKGSVWMEGECVQRAGVALLLLETLPGCNVPQPPSVIEAGCADVAPHRMKR